MSHAAEGGIAIEAAKDATACGNAVQSAEACKLRMQNARRRGDRARAAIEGGTVLYAGGDGNEGDNVHIADH